MTADMLDKLDFKKGNGLIPVVVQDAKTKEVLMQAYANRQAVEQTLKTGKGTYWSRTRKELWVKGKTSGHTQKIVSTLCSTWLSKLVQHATQAGTHAFLTKYFSIFLNFLFEL